MLTAKTPQKVVKKKGPSRADKPPKGSARYVLNSPEWMEVLKEREEKNEKNKAKTANQSAEPPASGKAAARKQKVQECPAQGIQRKPQETVI